MRLKLGKIMPYVLALGVLLALPTTVFADEYVAEVNGTQYTFLATAISEAAEGATITLLDDIKLDSTLAITQNVTIDGGSGDGETNYGITYTGSGSAISIDYEQEVTLKNLSVTAEKGKAVQMYAKDNTVKVTIDSCELTADQPLYIGAFKVVEELWCYYHELTVIDSVIEATTAVLTFQSAGASTGAASTVSITKSALTTKGYLVQFDENESSNTSDLQDITIEDCDIDMPEDGAAIYADHASVGAAGVFYCELKMDDDTMNQIPGKVYVLGANKGLVANLFDLADFADANGYGAASSGYYNAYANILKLVDDVVLSDSLICKFRTENGIAALDLNGHTLTMESGAKLTMYSQTNTGGNISIIDSSFDDSGSIIIEDGDWDEVYITSGNSAVIDIDADALDGYFGLIYLNTTTINDSDAIPTVNYNYSYFYDYGLFSGTEYVDDTYAIFAANEDVTYEEYGVTDNTWNTYYDFTVTFTNFPEDLTILNSTGAEWTFTVDDESVTLADGESYPLPVYVAEIGDGTQYESLADAVAKAENIDTITLFANVENSDTIKIEKNITIQGATGDEIITGSGRFNLSSGYEFKLDSLNFDTDNVYAVYVNGDEGTKLTINNCSFEEPNNTDSLTSVVYCNTSTYELVFTNNVVNGDYLKALLVYTSTGATITGNTFTGDNKMHGLDNDTEDTSFLTVKVLEGGENAEIVISNNVVDTYYKTISVDNSDVTGEFTISENAFVNCTYDFDLSTDNLVNTGYSLAKNYFDGGLPTILDSKDNSTYNNTTNTSDLVFYPYYQTYFGGVLSNLYKIDEDGVASGVIATVTDDDGNLINCLTWDDVMTNLDKMDDEVVITLHDDVDVDKTVELTKSIIIDGGDGGYTIEVTGDDPVFKVTEEDVTIEIINCNFDVSESDAEYLIYSEVAFTLIFENNEIEGSASLIYMPLDGSNTLTVTTKY